MYVNLTALDFSLFYPKEKLIIAWKYQGENGQCLTKLIPKVSVKVNDPCSGNILQSLLYFEYQHQSFQHNNNNNNIFPI